MKKTVSVFLACLSIGILLNVCAAEEDIDKIKFNSLMCKLIEERNNKRIVLDNIELDVNVGSLGGIKKSYSENGLTINISFVAHDKNSASEFLFQFRLQENVFQMGLPIYVERGRTMEFSFYSQEMVAYTMACSCSDFY